MDYNKYGSEKLSIKNNTPKKSKKNKFKKTSQLNDNSIDDYSEKKNLFSGKNNKYKENSSKLKRLKKTIKDTFNEFTNKGLRKYKNINSDKNNYTNNISIPYFSIMIILYSVIYFFVYKSIKRRKNIEKIDEYIYENIYDENIYNRTLNKIMKMKKVVYTINFDNYDLLRNITRQEGFDYFAFLDTDLDKYNYTNWTILPVPEEVKNLNISIHKKTRYIKTHPHLYFQNYSLSIYIDAAYPIIGDLNEFLLRILEPKYNIYTLEHFDRNCVYQEIKRVVEIKREKKEIADIVEEKYKKENVPHELGLIEGALIIRKHNEKECIYLMELWWEQIKNYSHRDQLSFNYVLWKTGIKIKYFPKNFASRYFNLIWNHLKVK